MAIVAFQGPRVVPERQGTLSEHQGVLDGWVRAVCAGFGLDVPVGPQCQRVLSGRIC